MSWLWRTPECMRHLPLDACAAASLKALVVSAALCLSFVTCLNIWGPPSAPRGLEQFYAALMGSLMLGWLGYTLIVFPGYSLLRHGFGGFVILTAAGAAIGLSIGILASILIPNTDGIIALFWPAMLIGGACCAALWWMMALRESHRAQ